MHGGKGALIVEQRTGKGRAADGLGRELRLVGVAPRNRDTVAAAIGGAAREHAALDALSLASRRRSVAYGRARGQA